MNTVALAGVILSILLGGVYTVTSVRRRNGFPPLQIIVLFMTECGGLYTLVACVICSIHVLYRQDSGPEVTFVLSASAFLSAGAGYWLCGRVWREYQGVSARKLKAVTLRAQRVR